MVVIAGIEKLRVFINGRGSKLAHFQFFQWPTRERLDYLASSFDDVKACTAVAKDEVFDQESVEVLPEEWKLEPDEFLLVTQYLKRYFTNSAWLIVENGLNSFKQQQKQGIFFVYLFMFHSFSFFWGGGTKSGNKYLCKSLIQLSLLLFSYLFYFNFNYYNGNYYYILCAWIIWRTGQGRGQCHEYITSSVFQNCVIHAKGINCFILIPQIPQMKRSMSWFNSQSFSLVSRKPK